MKVSALHDTSATHRVQGPRKSRQQCAPRESHSCRQCAALNSEMHTDISNTHPPPICERVMGHVTRKSHVACMNETCHTYGWLMSHIWMRHAIDLRHRVAYRLGACHMRHMWHPNDVPHEASDLWRDAFICATWGTYVICGTCGIVWVHVAHMNASWHTYEASCGTYDMHPHEYPCTLACYVTGGWVWRDRMSVFVYPWVCVSRWKRALAHPPSWNVSAYVSWCVLVCVYMYTHILSHSLLQNKHPSKNVYWVCVLTCVLTRIGALDVHTLSCNASSQESLTHASACL